MKIFSLLILFCTTLCFGCKLEDIANTNNPGNNPGDTTTGVAIAIDDLIDYLPDGYTKGSQVVFKDTFGNEKKLKTKFIESQKEKTEYGRTYSYEQFLVRLFDESDSYFLMEVDGSGSYSPDGEVRKVIGAMLRPLNSNSNSFVNIQFENGQPIVTMFDRYKLSTTFLGRSFEKVYLSNKLLTGNSSYSEIGFNSTEGVVAFRDVQNTLWVFDRFEE